MPLPDALRREPIVGIGVYTGLLDAAESALLPDAFSLPPGDIRAPIGA
jgi:hypothetical protein